MLRPRCPGAGAWLRRGRIAAAALAVCAAAIPDGVRLQVKQHDPGWAESPRLWVALVGGPSTKKSPLMATASKPLREIDHGLGSGLHGCCAGAYRDETGTAVSAGSCS
ncbi:DUF3987 domain-containing protein [Bosea sp. (in: a-proteobacteria)]|uniref:DUF3987 domain-containing protein n=1 Tax=Bosea sp. (in: a-proteobacteria) TaxID=1871050 RepID=UPI001AD281C4|nr:DUF3987 domain-containing protein [Bosea sp. (in: a-proteobacteria)]